MKLNQDVYKLMQERLLNECRTMRSIRQEMKKLAAAHIRYLDLEDGLAKRRHRASIILGLFGPGRIADTKKIADADVAACLEETLAERLTPQELRKRLRLWRAIREYVRVAGESKVGDIQAFLEWLGMEGVTRQAIESALKQHKEEFVITRRGRERYVAPKK